MERVRADVRGRGGGRVIPALVLYSGVAVGDLAEANGRGARAQRGGEEDVLYAAVKGDNVHQVDVKETPPAFRGKELGPHSGERGSRVLEPDDRCVLVGHSAS